MGMEVPASALAGDDETAAALAGRPSVVIVGPHGVGKRSIVNRLLAKQEDLKSTSSSGATCYGWKIDTKYYTADACIWTLNSDELGSENGVHSPLEHCEALIMVFDLSDPTTFEKLQEWIEAVDLTPYEVLMCVGNKADSLPSHFGHTEYRRRLKKRGESSSDPHPEFLDFGIDRTEGSSLLAEEGQDPEYKRHQCIEWCTERGIEYVEACAINEVFDQCMSVDGDLQGVPRILGALSAHMWPGLIMKPTEKQTNVDPVVLEDDEDFSSEDEEDYLIEYELLSNASTEPWDGNDEMWAFRGSDDPPLTVVSSTGDYQVTERIVTSASEANGHGDSVDNPEDAPSPSSMDSLVESTVIDTEDHIVVVELSDGIEQPEISAALDSIPMTVASDDLEVAEKSGTRDKEHGAEDLEQLMHEMASMRENMRTMSDGQRREMAAQLAMRMASMFKDGDGTETEDKDDF